MHNFAARHGPRTRRAKPDRPDGSIRSQSDSVFGARVAGRCLLAIRYHDHTRRSTPRAAAGPHESD